MKAPDFICVSEKGDTIRSQSLKDKGLIIVNMCGCGGDYESIDAYNEILTNFGGIYHILGVDSQFFKSTKGILINSENPFNEDFFRKFRQMYCSRATYVIEEDFRISKKFASKDWQIFLQDESPVLSGQ